VKPFVTIVTGDCFSPSHSKKHLPHGNEAMLKKNLKKGNIQSKNKLN
jgi:hypothetical protein